MGANGQETSSGLYSDDIPYLVRHMQQVAVASADMPEEDYETFRDARVSEESIALNELMDEPASMERVSIMKQDMSEARSPVLRGSMAALRRAAFLAREIAIQTDTEIVIVSGGVRRKVTADELRRGG